MLGRRKIFICCIQEVRYRNEGTTTIGTEDEKKNLWYSGNNAASGGVGILVRQDMVQNVVEVERHSDRIIQVKLVFCYNIYIISLYPRKLV